MKNCGVKKVKFLVLFTFSRYSVHLYLLSYALTFMAGLVISSKKQIPYLH